VVYGALAAVLAVALWWSASGTGEVTAAWQATLRDTFARLGVGAEDPSALLRRLCIGVLVIATGAAPWLWWRVWGSWAAALVSAPVMLGFGFVFDFPVIDAVPAIAIFLSLPLLAAALRRPTAPTLPVALGVSAASAAASLVHPLAGLPVLLGTLGAVLTSRRTLGRRAGVAIAVVGVHLAVSPGLMEVADRLGGDRPGGTAGSTHASLPAALGQGAYFGLGWFENPWGIEAVDDPVLSPGAAAAYSDPAGQRRLRSEVLTAFEREPTRVAGAIGHKAVIALADGLVRYPLLPVMVLILIALGVPDGRRRFAYVAGPALGGALVGPAVASPLPHYELGVIAIFGVVWLWALTGVATALSRRAPWERGLPRLTLSASDRRRLGAAAAGGALVAVAIASPVVDRLRVNPRVVYAAGASPPVAFQTTARVPEVAWHFDRGLPSGWAAVKGVELDASTTGLRVRTASGAGYQLLAPARRLAEGTHEVLVRATIEEGGLYVGALHGGSGRFLAVARYSERQSNGRPLPMGFRLHLDRPTPVLLVIGNWNAHDTASTWSLQRLTVARLSDPGGRTSQAATSRRSGALEALIESAVATTRRPHSSRP
jgi:hypothetical protein